ncbi:MAG: class I SAM-dependent methyltransferase [Myxococcota bacterium]|nr:class I SAM-dependent methyltransferase [Myxococcota bacterium]
MSLRDAESLDGRALPPLDGDGPYPAVDLADWAERRYRLNPGHPDLPALHDGAAAPQAALDNLVGMRTWWFEHPDWMDFLTPGHPGHDDKLLERAMYMDRWADHIPAGSRVLDVGGGIGRFTQWCLDRGCDVHLVDPDLRSLWAAVRHAGGRPGRLDVHWTTGDRLPSIAPVDVVIAAEVLCYVPDPRAVVDAAMALLKPGGALLCSVEARYGWAMGPDVAEGSIDAFFGDGVVHVDGDRWVRTYTEAELRDVLKGLEILELEPSHYVLSGPFEAAAGAIDLDRLRALEHRFRNHPITAPLNRAWMATARRGV